MNITILGNGAVGRRYAPLLQEAGHQVKFGVRVGRAKQQANPYPIASFQDAAQWAEMVLLAIPFSACPEVLPALTAEIADKVLIDATNPLQANWSPLVLGAETSAGEEIARMLPRARVVKAFNTVFADAATPERLRKSNGRVTALIAGNDETANRQVAQLSRAMGFDPLVTGPLANARYLEAMAHLNIAIAQRQPSGTHGAFLYDAAADLAGVS